MKKKMSYQKKKSLPERSKRARSVLEDGNEHTHGLVNHVLLENMGERMKKKMFFQKLFFSKISLPERSGGRYQFWRAVMKIPFG